MNKELLREKLAKHKLWLYKEEGGERLVIRNTDLSGIDLSYQDLRKADLRGCNFYKSKLDKADFEGANLSRCNMHFCSAEKVNFAYADLRHSNISNSNLKNANFCYAILNDCNIAHNAMRGIMLYKTNMFGTNFDGNKGLSFSSDRETGNYKTLDEKVGKNYEIETINAEIRIKNRAV